jgi:hypothetical protein
MHCVELWVYKAVPLNVKPATTAWRSNSEQTIGYSVTHKADQQSHGSMFLVTWYYLHYRTLRKCLFLLLLTGLEPNVPVDWLSLPLCTGGIPGLNLSPDIDCPVSAVFQSLIRQILKQYLE